MYHKYLRTLTRVNHKLAIIIGVNVSFFNQASRKIKNKAKKAWVKDQFINPHENLFTTNETLKWFEENNVEFLNLIPYYGIQDQNCI